MRHKATGGLKDANVSYLVQTVDILGKRGNESTHVNTLAQVKILYPHRNAEGSQAIAIQLLCGPML